jgi:small-conductance mechanosensitive channel
VSGALGNGVRGIIEHIGLVSTRLRDGYSTIHLPHTALLSVRNLSQEPVETRLSIHVPVDDLPPDAATRAAETIRELAGSPNLTEVMIVDDVLMTTPIAGNDQVELKVRTTRALTPEERETLVRRTEERLSAQDS